MLPILLRESKANDSHLGLVTCRYSCSRRRYIASVTDNAMACAWACARACASACVRATCSKRRICSASQCDGLLPGREGVEAARTSMTLSREGAPLMGGALVVRSQTDIGLAQVSRPLSP